VVLFFSSFHRYRGTYLGIDVAIKYLRAEHVNDSSSVEFLQEIMILRSVKHENVIRYYGACTKHRKYLIVTGQTKKDLLLLQNHIKVLVHGDNYTMINIGG